MRSGPVSAPIMPGIQCLSMDGQSQEMWKHRKVPKTKRRSTVSGNMVASKRRGKVNFGLINLNPKDHIQID
jgi:hypothetical protein